jgi:hypothetical protein
MRRRHLRGPRGAEPARNVVQRMSEDKINPDLLGARVLTLTAEV